MKRMLVVLMAIFIVAGIVYGQKVSQGEEFKKGMQDIDAQIKNFNAAYAAMDKPKAAASIDALAKDFENVEVHFAKLQKADAINWAKDARNRLKEAQDRLKREDISYALNLLQLAQKTCKSCHEAYRPAAAKTTNNN